MRSGKKHAILVADLVKQMPTCSELALDRRFESQGLKDDNNQNQLAPLCTMFLPVQKNQV